MKEERIPDIDEFLELLNELGKLLCRILDFVPSKELSYPIPVKDGCTLILSVKKA